MVVAVAVLSCVSGVPPARICALTEVSFSPPHSLSQSLSRYSLRLCVRITVPKLEKHIDSELRVLLNRPYCLLRTTGALWNVVKYVIVRD